MPKDDLVEVDGVILEAMGGGQYSIKPSDGSAIIRASLCGKMKQKHIRVMPGDRVTVGVSPYDLTHGIIIWRFK
jgi:translation initiation factor IF-1